MTVNDSPVEENGLLPKQEQFIAALVAGNSIVVAAKVVGIAEKTAHRWFKLCEFKQALKDAKRDVFASALDGLMDVVEGSIKTLVDIRDDGKAPYAVRVRSAQILLDNAVKMHRDDEIEMRLQELEEAEKTKYQ